MRHTIRRPIVILLALGLLAGTSACGFDAEIGHTRTLASTSAQAGWPKTHSAEYGFTIAFPDAPHKDTSQYWTFDTGEKAPITRWIHPTDDPDYIVHVTETSATGDANPVAGWDAPDLDTARGFYEQWPGLFARKQGGTASDIRMTTLDGHAAVAATLSLPDGNGGTFKARMAAIVVKGNIITLLTRGDALHEAFVNSFTLD